MSNPPITPITQALISGEPQSPLRTLKFLRGALLSDFYKGYPVHFLDGEESPELFAESLQIHSGLAQATQLSSKSRKGRRELTAPARILVHWPTLLTQAMDLALLKPELAIFLLGFREVIGLKSPFVLEALTRHYSLTAREQVRLTRVKPYVETLDDIDLPISPAAERDSLRAYLNVLASDPVFISTLQQVSAETYLEVPAKLALRGRSTHFRCVAKSHRDACSMLDLAGPLSCAPKFVRPIPKLPADSTDFSCGHLNWILRELWVAYHLSRRFDNSRAGRDTWEKDIVQNFGVASDKNYLIINWERWLGYRNKLKMTPTYLDYVYPRNTVKAKGRKASLFRTLFPRVAQQVALDYPRMPASPLNLSSGVRKRLDILWGSEWSDTVVEEGLSNTTVIDLLYLRSLTRMRYKQSLGRRTIRPASGIAKVKADYSPLYYHFTIKSIDPKTLHKKSYDCTAIHVGRRILFQPSWDLFDARIYKRPKHSEGDYAYISSAGMAKEHEHTLDKDTGSAVKYVLRNGVERLPPNDTLSYRAEVLLDRDFSDTAPRTAEIIQEIRRVSSFTRKMFHNLCAIQLGAMSDSDDEEPKARRSSRGWPYAADLAIKLLYRPGMTEEDTVKLLEACNPKTLYDIAHRACYLRKELIAKGVYDVNELPRSRYSAKLLREISAAKKAAAKKK